MALIVNPLPGVGRPLVEGGPVTNESSQSAVSWAAIFSGALAAVSITLVLLALVAGLGLTSISPWPNSGASASTFTIGAGIGLIVVQWLAAGIGGFVTGRLRTKMGQCAARSRDFFRDTAHGFLAWALATVTGILLFASAASTIIGGGVHAAATVAGGAA